MVPFSAPVLDRCCTVWYRCLASRKLNILKAEQEHRHGNQASVAVLASPLVLLRILAAKMCTFEAEFPPLMGSVRILRHLTFGT